MGVLTKKEYDSLSKQTKKRKKVDIVLKKEVKKTFNSLYVLLHPDNPVDGRLSFEDTLSLDGAMIKRVCENGIVRTKEKCLADFLISKGYELLHKENIDDN